MRVARVLSAIAATALLVTGCGQMKNQATEALTSIETAIAPLKDDGMKYAPVAYQGVESTLATLKDSLAKEDYKSVMAGTPELNKAVDSLKTAIASGKEQFEKASADWGSLSEDVPKLVADIETRVDALVKKRPKNVTKEAVESAKSGLDSLKSSWAEATAASMDGKVTEAAEKANAVKAKAAELLASLTST